MANSYSERRLGLDRRSERRTGLDRRRIRRLRQDDVVKYFDGAGEAYFLVGEVDIQNNRVHGRIMRSLHEENTLSIDHLVEMGIDVAKWRRPKLLVTPSQLTNNNS